MQKAPERSGAFFVPPVGGKQTRSEREGYRNGGNDRATEGAPEQQAGEAFPGFLAIGQNLIIDR
jgi:hypothetical protein